jgi:hypothetical protein
LNHSIGNLIPTKVWRQRNLFGSIFTDYAKRSTLKAKRYTPNVELSSRQAEIPSVREPALSIKRSAFSISSSIREDRIMISETCVAPRSPRQRNLDGSLFTNYAKRSTHKAERYLLNVKLSNNLAESFSFGHQR